jgi:hypothetical protein
VLAFFGDGERVRHDKCDDDETEDFAEELGLCSVSVVIERPSVLCAPRRRFLALLLS